MTAALPVTSRSLCLPCGGMSGLGEEALRRTKGTLGTAARAANQIVGKQLQWCAMSADWAAAAKCALFEHQRSISRSSLIIAGRHNPRAHWQSETTASSAT